MILPNTPYAEIIRVMEEEKPKVAFELEKQKMKAMKAYERGCQLPYMQFKRYTVPSSSNTYLVWVYLKREETDMIGRLCRDIIRSGSALMINNEQGSHELYILKDYIQTGPEGDANIQTLHVFTGHFFGRYRERTKSWSKLTSNELFANFLGRNIAYMLKLKADKLVRRKDYRNASVWQLSDGYSFGTREDIQTPSGRTIPIVRHNTFITESMLFDRQARNTVPLPVVELILSNYNKTP